MARHFVIRTTVTRPAMMTDGLNEQERSAFGRHASWMQQKVADGTLIVVGRVGPGYGGSSPWAIAILKAEDDADATAIMHEDPFVAEGVVVSELFPFDLVYLEPQNALRPS